MSAKIAPEPVAPEPPSLELTHFAAAVALEPRIPDVSDNPLQDAAQPQLPPVRDLPATTPDALAPDADTTLEKLVTSGILCPRCSGNTLLAPLRSVLDRLIDKLTHRRECALCGYRFSVIRFLGHQH